MLEVQCCTTKVAIVVTNVAQMQHSPNLGLAFVAKEYDLSVRKVMMTYYVHILRTNVE